MPDTKTLDNRPAAFFDKYHRIARTGSPKWVYQLARCILWPYCRALYRLEEQGRENIPATGPVILAPIHYSLMDHFVVAARLKRRVRFVAKSELFRCPLKFILSRGGAVPVRRGKRDEELFVTVAAILRKGEVVVKYSGGKRIKNGLRHAEAKYGIGRVALRSGAPVVPVAIYGTHRINLRRLRLFPKVVVRYGKPILYGSQPQALRWRQQQVADDIMAAINWLQDELDAEMTRRRQKPRWRRVLKRP